MKKKSKEPEQRFVVHVGKREAIVGFRYPGLKTDPGVGENVLRDGEIRVASHVIAVLGRRTVYAAYEWTTAASALFIASTIKDAKVVPL